MQIGQHVEHLELGFGSVVKALGDIAIVNFSGENIEVNVNELIVSDAYRPEVQDGQKREIDQITFRRSYEAINLGVVPPDPMALIEMTIGGEQVIDSVSKWLKDAPDKGLCKVVFGNYGTGKSHYLKVVRSIALKAGWVISSIEFDPKTADPAKPHLVYRELMSHLSFPNRVDGTITDGFLGFIREIRRNWNKIINLKYLKRSPWFKNVLEVLLYYPHSTDQDYLDGCYWLAGQPIDLRAIRSLAKYQGLKATKIPRMPKIKETADIYVFHLVVINEICRALGYAGFLIILDEAEHVRGYNVRRKERANNFFDLLSRSAHTPITVNDTPIPNDHNFVLPEYWKHGPHFSLCVGLTEGDIFSDASLSLREACVFLYSEEDRLNLQSPTPKEYEAWCRNFLKQFYRFHPESTQLISSDDNQKAIASALREEFKNVSENDRLLRIWVKLASLIPSALLARNANSLEELINIIRKAAKEVNRYVLPWENI